MSNEDHLPVPPAMMPALQLGILWWDWLPHPIRDPSKRIIAWPPDGWCSARHQEIASYACLQLIHYAGGRHTAVIAMLSADRSPPSPPELLELTCCSPSWNIICCYCIFIAIKNGSRKYTKMPIIRREMLTRTPKENVWVKCERIKWKMNMCVFND